MVEIKQQKDFPYLKEFKEKFNTTEDTIFVFDKNIYANAKKEDIPYDVIHHEIKHLLQQKEIGKDIWIHKYLTDDSFRLEQETEAYKYQLEKVKETGDRNELFNITDECANNLCKGMYGIKITKRQAMEMLK